MYSEKMLQTFSALYSLVKDEDIYCLSEVIFHRIMTSEHRYNLNSLPVSSFKIKGEFTLWINRLNILIYKQLLKSAYQIVMEALNKLLAANIKIVTIIIAMNTM